MTHTVPGAPAWDQVHAPIASPPSGSGPQADPTLWSEGTVRGRDVVLGAAILGLLVVSLDLLLTGRLSFFFDLCLVPISLIAALAVRPRDFFWVAVLPPLLVLGATLQLGFAAPAALGSEAAGPLQATVVGLADHGAATLWSQALVLGILFVRRRVLALPALVPPSGKLSPPVDVQGDLVAAYDEALETVGPEALARVDAMNADADIRRSS